VRSLGRHAARARRYRRARVFSDANDDDQAQPGEETVRTGEGFLYDFISFPEAMDGGCTPTALCSWDPGTPTSWRDNRDHAAVQAFWFANRFHDHLAAPPIGFDAASGAFEGPDKLVVHANDGAATGEDGGPDPNHVGSAFMVSRPDGRSPLMALLLFKRRNITLATGASLVLPYRAVNAADYAKVVYHEYTHGMSNRLLRSASGFGALASRQAFAIDEGLADWYAADLVAREGHQPDDPSVEGEVDGGEYLDASHMSFAPSPPTAESAAPPPPVRARRELDPAVIRTVTSGG